MGQHRFDYLPYRNYTVPLVSVSTNTPVISQRVQSYSSNHFWTHEKQLNSLSYPSENVDTLNFTKTRRKTFNLTVWVNLQPTLCPYLADLRDHV